MSNVQCHWFALVVKPRHEKTVDSMLRIKGLESFLPLYTTRRRWADRYKNVQLPLFPGYVFSRFDSSFRSGVLSTPGLFDIVRSGKEFAAIPDNEIADLQRAMNSGLTTEPWPYLATGEVVEMDRGPLHGLTGTVLEIKKSTRLVLTVSLLSRSVLVEIDRDWVHPIACRRRQAGEPRRGSQPNLAGE